MSFPTTPTNGQQAVVNGITYIYNATNNAWKRQALSNISITGNITVGGIIFPDGGSISTGYVYDFDPIVADGRKNEFQLRYNNSVTSSFTNPWNLLVTVNGAFQPAFLTTQETVWLTHVLAAYTGYTLSSGNLKFAETPSAGSTVYVRTQPGSQNPVAKIYPFKPIDIMLGI